VWNFYSEPSARHLVLLTDTLAKTDRDEKTVRLCALSAVIDNSKVGGLVVKVSELNLKNEIWPLRYMRGNFRRNCTFSRLY
jgi:hypothetical protein